MKVFALTATIRELVALTAAVLGVPAAVVSIMYLFQSGPIFNAFYGALITFIVGLIVYHLICWLFRRQATQHLPKHIDYIYLLVAGIGIFGAAEVTQSATEQATQQYIDDLYLKRRATLDLANVDHAKFCIISRRKQECKVHIAALSPITMLIFGQSAHVLADDYYQGEERKYRQGLSKPHWTIGDVIFTSKNEEYRKNFESVLPVVDNFKKASDLAQISDPVSSDFKTKIKEFSDEIQRNTESMRSLVNSPFPSINKLLGFLLLASALAMRITKVTVEIKKWHGDPPPQPNQKASPV